MHSHININPWTLYLHCFWTCQLELTFSILVSLTIPPSTRLKIFFPSGLYASILSWLLRPSDAYSTNNVRKYWNDPSSSLTHMHMHALYMFAFIPRPYLSWHQHETNSVRVAMVSRIKRWLQSLVICWIEFSSVVWYVFKVFFLNFRLPFQTRCVTLPG